jgi:peptidoglycan hydrolase-like protein with peptidoglycan-binding domain
MRTAAQHVNRQHVSRQDVVQAQQTLKTEGFYKGRIDGKMSRGTRLAITHFQQRNHLPRTAKLDRTTLDRLMGSQGAGVGSSMPQSMPQAGLRGTTSIPQTNQAPSAGGSNLPSNQGKTQ